ncbi:MAG: hypothetical protein CMJ39_00520 [Phycisphaerae bacterium]|nr:hypothetical protein [Phycisphaerae bacterium]
MFSSPSLVRYYQTEASYDDILNNMDNNSDLRAMRENVEKNGAVYFVYRGGEDRVLLMSKKITQIIDGDISRIIDQCKDGLYVFCYV